MICVKCGHGPVYPENSVVRCKQYRAGWTPRLGLVRICTTVLAFDSDDEPVYPNNEE